MMSPHRAITAWVLLATAVLVSGCFGFRMEVGRRVDPALLETTLRIGESTRENVLAVLGEPGGRGRSLLPIDRTPKTVWLYYYSETNVESNELKDVRQILLWVYLDGDRYDGYMWFSSLPRMSARLVAAESP